MKTIAKALAVILSMGFFVCSAPQKAKAQVAVSFQVFYDDLSPYGEWVESPSYGYIWVPSVGVGFTPYGTAGHWVYTSFGWTWISDYSWGWAPFHYGRWVYDPNYGWSWIPGEDWGPAWVSWRVCDGFYGWAPLGPGVWVGASIPVAYWRFVPYAHFTDYHVASYYAPRTNYSTYIKQSTVINETGKSGGVSYYTGPPKASVEKNMGRSVAQYSVNERSKPGQSVANNTVSLYRSKVMSRNSGGNKPVPSKVVQYKETKQATNGSMSISRNRSGQTVNHQQTVQHQSGQQRPNIANRPSGSQQMRRINNTRMQPPGSKNYRQANPIQNRMPPQPQFRGITPVNPREAYKAGQASNGRHR